MKVVLVALVILVLGIGMAESAAAGEPIVVNTAADSGDGTCDEKECTLREALAQAHAIPGANTIAFNIPGTGPHLIAPLSPLPGSVQPLTIDGTTDPDYAGQPIVQLNGQNVDAAANGLSLDGGGNVVRGLAINRWPMAGIRFGAGDGNLVEDNYVGTDLTGGVALPNAVDGVLFAGSSGNVIRGNLISGNGHYGLNFSASDGNVVQGNKVGTDITGTFALANEYDGVAIDGVNNLIGGSEPGQGNLLSGNSFAGLFIYEEFAHENRVYGNLIGTNATGKLPLPNLSHGVRIGANARDNTIGGLEPGQANLIAYNEGAGVEVDGLRNTVSGNAMHDNAGEGISLIGGGANDPNDSDTGANELQNFPVIEAATPDELTLRLDSLPESLFRVEVFANSICDDGGHGEGEKLLGIVDLTTDAEGDASSAVDLAGAKEGEYLTATATDSLGNTSQFSECTLVGDSAGVLLFEGWNPLTWKASPIEGADAIIAALNNSVEPEAWESIARYDEEWRQTFHEAPLPSFNTLTSIATGDDVWLFLNEEAEIFFLQR